MPVRNLAVAAVFEEIADRLEIQDANPFRVRAYRKAARTVQELPEDVGELVARGQTVEGLPGIGADLAGKVAEIASTGTCTLVEQLRRQLPPAITELLRVPGLGPKRVKVLWQELHVQTPEQALRAACDGRVQGLHGFGEMMAKNIEHALRANSDAHAARELDNLRFGVGQARRGWITASDVLNARPLSQVLALLRPASKRRATRAAVMV